MLLPSIFIFLTFLLYDLSFDVKIMWFVLLMLRTRLFVAKQVDILITSCLVSLIKYSKFHVYEINLNHQRIGLF